MALESLVNGLLAPVRRQELAELIDDLVVAGDAQLRAQLGEVGEDGVVGPGVVGILLPQHAAEAVAVGVHSLEHPGGHLRQCDKLPDKGHSCRLREQQVRGRLHLPLRIRVGVDGPNREGLEPLGAPSVQGVVGTALPLRVRQPVELPARGMKSAPSPAAR